MSGKTSETRCKTRKILPCYIEAYLEPRHCKYVTDTFVKDRRIALYGIEVCLVLDGGKTRVDPVIPCVGPLMRLVQDNKSATSFSFNHKTKRWKMMR